MLRSINNSYVTDYLTQAEKQVIDKNNPAVILLKKIYDVVNRDNFYPGSLLYSRGDQVIRELFRRFEILPRSGIGQATWCTFAVYYILDEMGYSCKPILDLDPTTKIPSIGYTTADEMYNNAMADRVNCCQLNWKDAVIKANAGIPILIAAIGKGKNQPHVGIVAPTFQNIDKMSILDVMVGQAGFYNGFGTLNDFFNKQYVNEPAFFELKRK